MGGGGVKQYEQNLKATSCKRQYLLEGKTGKKKQASLKVKTVERVKRRWLGQYNIEREERQKRGVVANSKNKFCVKSKRRDMPAGRVKVSHL